MKILQLNEKDGLPVQLKWFNHLPIYNEKDIPNYFNEDKYPTCINYPSIQVDHEEIQQFESNPFASSFAQEISTYEENCNDNDNLFENYFAMVDNVEIVGLTNEIKPYSMLIDVFKELTNHLEGHSTHEHINELRSYLSNQIVEAKKRAADSLKLSNIEDKSEFILVTLSSSKKRKTHGTKHY